MTELRILATTDLGTAVVPMEATYGRTGTVHGVVHLLERERARRPTIWLDVGDLTVGPAMVLLDERPWDELASLPIACTTAGNHDFDDGVQALRAGAARLTYPMLCANVDAGLPGTAMLDAPAGVVGVIGLAHPRGDAFTAAPPALADWPERVGELARQLRRDGARWVVALLHDGVTWWPSADTIATRPDRLDALVRPWAGAVDLIVGGHNFGAWTGTLGGTPAGEAHVYAASVLVADLLPGGAAVRGVVPVPPVRPETSPRSPKRSTPPPRGWSARAPSGGSPARTPSATCRTASPTRSGARAAPTPRSSRPPTTVGRRRSTARWPSSRPAR